MPHQTFYVSPGEVATNKRAITIEVAFDAKAQVYIATSPTVRGLVVEAATLDEVRATVEQVLPELLRLNRLDQVAEQACVTEDQEDYRQAIEVLERVRTGQEPVYSTDEIRKDLGLDNN